MQKLFFFSLCALVLFTIIEAKPGCGYTSYEVSYGGEDDQGTYDGGYGGGQGGDNDRGRNGGGRRGSGGNRRGGRGGGRGNYGSEEQEDDDYDDDYTYKPKLRCHGRNCRINNIGNGRGNHNEVDIYE